MSVHFQVQSGISFHFHPDACRLAVADCPLHIHHRPAELSISDVPERIRAGNRQWRYVSSFFSTLAMKEEIGKSVYSMEISCFHLGSWNLLLSQMYLSFTILQSINASENQELAFGSSCSHSSTAFRSLSESSSHTFSNRWVNVQELLFMGNLCRRIQHVFYRIFEFFLLSPLCHSHQRRIAIEWQAKNHENS